MPEVSINFGTAAYEADMQQFEHAVDCLVNKIGEIAWAVQLVCFKPSWVQEFRARGSCKYFRIDISFHRLLVMHQSFVTTAPPQTGMAGDNDFSLFSGGPCGRVGKVAEFQRS